MSLYGLVNEGDISRLDLGAFRRVLNKLLTVEASIHGVSLADLDLTLRENDPDEGIDARIKWPEAVQHDILHVGEIVVQYKTGKISKKVLDDEFKKPGVQKALGSGGHYLLLASQGCVPAKVKELRAHLAKLCQVKKLSESRCEILLADHVARWVCRHPAVIITPALGKGLPGFSTVESWSQHPAMRNPWQPDAERAEIVSQIRGLLGQEEVLDPVIRIEGSAGVGKTRLALESINATGIADRTIYAPNGDDQSVNQLLSAIQGDSKSYGVVVVDECERERQDILSSYAALAGGRLRLICVGPGDVLYDSPSRATHVFPISAMTEESMQRILTSAVEQIPSEVVRISVRLSGGSPKLCLFVAKEILSAPTITSEELRKIYSIRQFLKRFLAPEIQDALRALSVLQRLGWEDEARIEAQAVADYLGLEFSKLQEGVKALRDREVVVPRGRYLYVSPELLAIEAAADLWGIRGTGLIEIMHKLPGMRPRYELLKRLAVMGRHPEVRKVVEKLLGEDGLFKTLNDLDEEFRSTMFRILASALPDAAVAVLQRVIERAPRDQLLGFETGRRNVVGAIETLLRWPNISLQAARALRSLAIAENESIGNNASAVFSEYFHMYLSRSPLPLTERLPLVDGLIDTAHDVSRNLATRALKSSLVLYESRMGGDVDELSKRGYPHEWRPRTCGELWDARRAAISRLELLAVGTDEAASEARKALIHGTFTLMNDGMTDDAIRILGSVQPSTDEERRDIVDMCRRLEIEVRQDLSPDQKANLQRITGTVFDDSYFGRLRRWVGRRLHTDFDREKGFAGPDERAAALADEGFRRGISEEELRWLASGEAENVWVFGLRLGELDGDLRFFDRIVAVSSNDVNAMFVAAYLQGRPNRSGNDARDSLLDHLSGEHPIMAFGCTWRTEPTQRGFERVVTLVSSQKVPAGMLRVLGYGGWTNALSADQIIRIVRLMLTAETESVLEAALSVLWHALSRDSGALIAFEPLIWELLEVTPPEPATMVDWYWGQLAETVAARNPERMVRLIADRYVSERFVSLSDERRQALQTATRADPSGAWAVVRERLAHNGEASWPLLTVLRGWYGQLVPVDELISWAKEHKPLGPVVAAQLVVAPGGPLSGLAREIALAFPGNHDVLNQLYASLRTGFSMGPYSGRLERDLAVAKQWADDPDPNISCWAARIVAGLQEELKRQKIREEEGDF